MTDKEAIEGIRVAISQLCSELSDEELTMLGMCVMFETNPMDKPFYKKAKSLFTLDNNTRVALVTKDALGLIINERLSH